MSEEKPVAPFSDLHVEGGHVRAVLLHDPTVEGLDVGLYLDASGSMREEYEYRAQRRTLREWLRGDPQKPRANEVEPQARWMLEYLASKDRNGRLRVAYWASGPSGRNVEVLGELQGSQARTYAFPGARELGGATHLSPAMRDYVEYLKSEVPHGARRGCAVFITDGRLHDKEGVEEFSAQVAKEIASGRLPRTHFVLVGVGDDVDARQLEEIAQHTYKGVGHLWCHRIAKEMGQVAELVAVLVDETMTVAAGGTVTDDLGRVLRVYEGRLPAVLEFDVPKGAKSFTLEVSGQRFTQPLTGAGPGHGDDDHP